MVVSAIVVVRVWVTPGTGEVIVVVNVMDARLVVTVKVRPMVS
jgi:hypothetical protein